jgi:hypothetical protein
MNHKNINFDLYRYQLLPITQNVQQDLYRKILTKDELIQKKNSLFHEVISNLPQLNTSANTILHQKVILDRSDWFVFKLGSQKSIEIENENFDKERINNWPHVTVIINNRPDFQLMAISKNRKAFSSTNVVANIIVESLRDHLANLQLTIHVKTIFEKKDFWHVVNSNQGRITSVKFELISPNMANISKSLKVDLKQINLDTNSHKTCLELNANEGATLEIKTDNEVIDGLVDYASEGGGDIRLKINGFKRSIHTQKTNKSIEIDELSIEGLSVESLELLLGGLKP